MSPIYSGPKFKEGDVVNINGVTFIIKKTSYSKTHDQYVYWLVNTKGVYLEKELELVASRKFEVGDRVSLIENCNSDFQKKYHMVGKSFEVTGIMDDEGRLRLKGVNSAVRFFPNWFRTIDVEESTSETQAISTKQQLVEQGWDWISLHKVR